MNYFIDCFIAVSNQKVFGKFQNVIVETIRNFIGEATAEEKNINNENVTHVFSNAPDKHFEAFIREGSILMSGLFEYQAKLALIIREVLPQDIELVLFDKDYHYDIPLKKGTSLNDIQKVFPNNEKTW